MVCLSSAYIILRHQCQTLLLRVNCWSQNLVFNWKAETCPNPVRGFRIQHKIKLQSSDPDYTLVMWRQHRPHGHLPNCANLWTLVSRILQPRPVHNSYYHLPEGILRGRAYYGGGGGRNSARIRNANELLTAMPCKRWIALVVRAETSGDDLENTIDNLDWRPKTRFPWWTFATLAMPDTFSFPGWWS